MLRNHAKSIQLKKLIFDKMHYKVLYTRFKMFHPKFIIYWLSQNFPYVEKLVHPAALAISLTVILSQNAEDVDAECVECALKIVVSRLLEFLIPNEQWFYVNPVCGEQHNKWRWRIIFLSSWRCFAQIQSYQSNHT